MSRLSSALRTRLRGFRNPLPPAPPAPRPRVTHVILLDGTMSSLRPGMETNVGLIYRLLSELGPEAATTLYYEPGIQWRGYRRSVEVMAGIGINRQIKRAYLFLARNYHPGDRIVLMGFSRGAYAVRSLAGLIDKMGLLRAAQVDEDTLNRVYDHYRSDPDGPRAEALKAALCHDAVEIAFLGVFDTVRALGLRWPILWRYAPMPHPFHNHALGPSTLQARHALGMHETRDAYAPVLWDVAPDQVPRVQQVWFRGTHGDIGGHLEGFNAARPLSNIPLVWMLEEASGCGLPLPWGWRLRYITDAGAPSVGTMRGWGKFFVSRHRRAIGRDPSERVHPTARAAAAKAGLTLPLTGAPLQGG